MNQMVTPGRVWSGLLVLFAGVPVLHAQNRPAAGPVAGTPAVCDTLRPRSRHAVDGGFGRLSSAAGTTAGAVAGTRATAGARRAGAPGRVRRDGRLAVGKDRPGRGSVVQKDQGVLCPQLGVNTGEVVPYPTQPVFEAPVPTASGGDVAPSAGPLPGVRPRGFFVPPLIGGLLFGGGAIAIANRPGSTPTEVPGVPTIPGTPTTPTTPPPTTPPTTPTPPMPTPPTVPPTTPPTTPPVPPTTPPAPPTAPPTTPPTTPTLPPVGPQAPTVVPEPATVALVGAGLLAVAGAARRRRRR